MLLVSQEDRGFTSRVVGGGPAATSTPPSAISLPKAGTASAELRPGEDPESLSLSVGEACTRQHRLSDGEVVVWDCAVADGLTVDFSVKVAQDNGLRVGRARFVSERQRGKRFVGRLDLGDEEYSGCFSPGPKLLTFEVGNRFSYFRAKQVQLRISIEAPEPLPSACASDYDVSPRSDGTPEVVRRVSRASELSTLGEGNGGEEDNRVVRLRRLLAESLRLCPQGACALREQLKQAQLRLSEYSAEQLAEYHAATSERTNPLE